jgi:leukotriene-A4 hydrolase
MQVMFSACSDTSNTNTMNTTIANDPHTFALVNEAIVTHLNWEAEIDFDNQIINASANWQIQTANDAKKIILDCKDLNIEKVLVDNIESEFTLSPPTKHMGSALVIPINANSKNVTVNYKTHKGAAALQWIEKEKTADKIAPFLFTQSQAILARSWIPCQDSPGIRFTYNAKVKVPQGILVVMSAENPREISNKGEYNFSMKQAIPSYLMALAAGSFHYAPIGKRTGIYAEQALIEASKEEFSEMENMVIAAEKLYGPYVWEIFDMLVLPPSFPFGGMENPRITFATPTIIAGDKSLTSLVAHELAHSWSGNLVTNETWNDFWLNEGFTVYFERRIMEALYGADYAEMLAHLGYQDLLETLDELGYDNPDTRLKLDLSGRNPDDGVTDIAYEKGYFLLRLIEEKIGRQGFDKFVSNYFETHKFKTMNTEKFLAYALKELAAYENELKEINVMEWIYKPGLPANCPIPNPTLFTQVEQQKNEYIKDFNASALQTKQWSTHEWLHFLRLLPSELKTSILQDLDLAFNLTHSGNSEILAVWFQLTIKNKYTRADEALEKFLVTVGRRKFLTPTYKSLMDVNHTKAKEIYEKARPNYHTVTIQTLDKLLKN